MGLEDAARQFADSAESLYRTANEFATTTHVCLGDPQIDAALTARQAKSALWAQVIGDDMAAAAAEATAQLFERGHGNQ
ncbi:hypothetical protein [Mycobacteroides abscessus]|uniref:hypothetical protein n=1 Tax=Mycobacteroides abscessus TaxID=36809 RepID=UPI0009A8AC4E|nr:hypothetical protein [Mycobacteroides abscessus]MDO3032082.1 hypothetical protein [Mycobacteroides abscessus subsp. massiliense]MDO3042064.1 hypothetical protein [Mycobacteroides abscessus subsp. abscessus]MDO3111497.1 hypothetical protein [Mycobacteroides abscessus subsp. massiliense]RIR19282.1 hypothetical protein D2E28_23585 [Mycobacteroides abscessus]SKU68640.1 Uncharacterised protein [Mycobacteroides abscessus subsp. massiliense]